MSPVAVPSRDQIDPRYTWNAPSVFPSEEAWEDEFAVILASLDDLKQYQGHLGESPAVLLDALEAGASLTRRVGQVHVYAEMSQAVDAGNQVAARRATRSRSLVSQALAATAFLEPELLAIGQETLQRWMQQEPRLTIYAHYFEDLYRKQAHVRSAEVEELLGMAADSFSGASDTFSMLTNADLRFAPAITSDGQEEPLTQSTWLKLLASGDRQVRRTAWENYLDAYLAFKNTLTSNLVTSVKQNVFKMRARRHKSTLEMALFENNIPVEVFHNLIDTFRRNLPIWHRYWAIRRKALGVDALHPYDIWAPLSANPPRIPFEQAVNWVCQALAPLGDEYVSIMRRGCLEDRWVDLYPNRGKAGGAFSTGSPGTHPFVLMSYVDDAISLGTLAHELGHSMHSYLIWQHQPMIYSDYSIFIAEVASNFHQAMLLAHVLENSADPALQLGLIEEAMVTFHRYFLIMPTLARFELEIHQRVECGQGLTADGLIDLLADLFAEAYGDGMQMDRQRVGIWWATFSHLYTDYYVYQYATGISGAYALSRRVLSGTAGAAEDYLDFLKAGSSIYPLEALRLAGVDLATPQPVEETFQVLSGLLDRLERLVAS